MDLGVASVEIKGIKLKVLFDFEDTSGDRVRELYCTHPIRPKTTDIILSNGLHYYGIYWPESGNHDFYFYDPITSGDIKYQYADNEITIHLPAPTPWDWRFSTSKYRIISGSSNTEVKLDDRSIGGRYDVNYMWAIAKKEDLCSAYKVF